MYSYIYITNPAIPNTPMAPVPFGSMNFPLFVMDAVIVRIFALWVLGCKWTLYVGTIQKNYFAPAEQLATRPQEIMSWCIVFAAVGPRRERANLYQFLQVNWSPRFIGSRQKRKYNTTLM